MTRSAGRGILETTSWKQAVAWHVERILLLKEIKFIAFRRNEVNSKARAPRANAIEQ
jgi:CRISPR-associated protein Cas5d